MTIRMSNLEQLTLAEMEEFVTTSRHVTWSAVEPGSVYRLVERVLKAHSYRRLISVREMSFEGLSTV